VDKRRGRRADRNWNCGLLADWNVFDMQTFVGGSNWISVGAINASSRRRLTHLGSSD